MPAAALRPALRLTGPAGSLTLPLEITKDIPDRTVWIPLNSTPGGAHRALGTAVGHLVTIAADTIAVATADATPDAGADAGAEPPATTGAATAGTPTTAPTAPTAEGEHR